VNVVYWGMWVGKDNGPWRLMCEEAINGNRLRRVVLSRSGTFYATDTQGVSVSTNGGCTWVTRQGGDLGALRPTDVAVDPMDGAAAFVTTGGAATMAAPNGLFETRSSGASFTRVAGLANPGNARQFLSVRVGPTTPRTLYVTSRAGQATQAASSRSGRWTASPRPRG
jgi:hypothetical protein